MTNSASHDLKEPVRTIKMYLTLLEKNIPGLSTENKDYIQYTKVASERLYYLINDLLAYSKIDHTDKELSAVDTTKVLKEVTESIQQLVVDKNAVIKFQKLPTVIANHNKLLLLFQNLIINGINYNKSDIPTIKISYKIKENTALIVVADNGIGIAEEYWDKIFQLFKRLHTESDYKGTGLGLAICKKIVERLNGKIWLRSQQEKGSEFYIQLPC
jgi:light-regulated signal transduction histidine kinase (bacteriophytochrome)